MIDPEEVLHEYDTELNTLVDNLLSALTSSLNELLPDERDARKLGLIAAVAARDLVENIRDANARKGFEVTFYRVDDELLIRVKNVSKER